MNRVIKNLDVNWIKKKKPKLLGEGVEFPSSSPSPNESAVENEKMEWLDNMIDALPEPKRTIIQLYLLDLSYKEISEMTEIPEKKIKNTIYLLKKELTKNI